MFLLLVGRNGVHKSKLATPSGEVDRSALLLAQYCSNCQNRLPYQSVSCTAAAELLDEIRTASPRVPGRTSRTSIDGLLLSKVTTGPALPEYSLTAPCSSSWPRAASTSCSAIAPTSTGQASASWSRRDLPVTGHWIGTSPEANPPLGAGPGRFGRRPSPRCCWRPPQGDGRAPRPTYRRWLPATPSADLLDAVVRMLRLLDEPADAAVLAPLIEKEILWRFAHRTTGRDAASDRAGR